MKILTPAHIIQKRLLDAIQSKLSDGVELKSIDAALKAAFDEIRREINQAIFDSKTFYSLINGTLKRDFGLTEEKTSLIPSIVDDLYEVDYEISFSRPEDIFTINIVVRARPENDPYVQSAIGRVQYLSKKPNQLGEIINWLQWLLFAGTEEIISGYRILNKPGIGRSYLGIMIKKSGASFSVDPEYAGTADDNFVTKTLISSADNIRAILRKYIK